MFVPFAVCRSLRPRVKLVRDTGRDSQFKDVGVIEMKSFFIPLFILSVCSRPLVHVWRN